MHGKDSRLKNRRGAVLVVTALSMVTLLMLLAFVVDIGRIYVERSELQVSADAGAHAGAIRLNGTSPTKSVVVAAALQFADSNAVFGGSARFSDSTVTCGNWDSVNRVYTRNSSATECQGGDNAVQATRAATEGPMFAAILKHTAGTVTTRAVGWVAPTISGTSCIKPLAVDYAILITALNALRTPPSSNLYRPLDNTDFNLLRTQSPALKFCIKDGPPGKKTCPNTAQPPGNFGIIGLVPGDGGGSNYTKELGAVFPCSEGQVISAGDNVDVITGGKVGPTNAGVTAFCTSVTPCIMMFPLVNATVFAAGANATDGKPCTGGTNGTPICYPVISIGAGVIDYPALPNTPNGAVTGHFTLALDPGAVVGGTTRGLLSRIILVQ